MHTSAFTSLRAGLAATAMATLGLCGALSWARADEHPSPRRDHDRARAALQAGEILSLQQVLTRVQPQYPGEVLGVELEREDGRWIYELKLLQPGGRLVRLDVEAKTGEVLRSRSRPALPTVPSPSPSQVKP